MQKPFTIGAAFAATLIIYLLIAWFAIHAAIATHTPCASDFEGGCGYGKAWAGLLSWLAACMALAPAAGIGAFGSALPRFKRPLLAGAVVLALPALAYVLYGIVKVAPLALDLLR